MSTLKFRLHTNFIDQGNEKIATAANFCQCTYPPPNNVRKLKSPCAFLHELHFQRSVRRHSNYGAPLRKAKEKAVHTAHQRYLALALADAVLHAAYRELFRYALEPGLADQLPEATNGNFTLGNTRFIAEIEPNLCRYVTRGKAGRPPKPRRALGEDAES
jgi:hypothetical protein